MITNKQLSEKMTVKLRTSVTAYFYGLNHSNISVEIANPLKYPLGLSLDILPIVNELTGLKYTINTLTIGLGVVVLELRRVKE